MKDWFDSPSGHIVASYTLLLTGVALYAFGVHDIGKEVVTGAMLLFSRSMQGINGLYSKPKTEATPKVEKPNEPRQGNALSQ